MGLFGGEAWLNPDAAPYRMLGDILSRDNLVPQSTEGGLWLRDPDDFLIHFWSDRAQRDQCSRCSDLLPNYRHPSPVFDTVGLSGIELRVSDLSRSASFYARIVGSEASSPDPRRLTTFRFGPTELTLLDVGEAVRAGRTGLQSVSMRVKSFTPTSAESKLKDRGVEDFEIDRRGRVFFHDPWGFDWVVIPENV